MLAQQGEQSDRSYEIARLLDKVHESGGDAERLAQELATDEYAKGLTQKPLDLLRDLVDVFGNEFRRGTRVEAIMAMEASVTGNPELCAWARTSAAGP